MAVLQKVRLIGNERLDLPDFLNLDSFACADWGQFFEKYMAPTPFIAQGFELLNPAAFINTSNTTVTVVLADSVMFHPTSSNARGGFFVASSEEASQSVALTPNATNYVEMDHTTETGAPDTRFFWDPSANGGAGAEFSQVIDTVTFLKVEVTVNTVGFTDGKVPIAKVTVNNAPTPVITAITDCRPMFFRLGAGGTNPDPLYSHLWTDSPAGYARSDVPVTMTNNTDPNPFQGSDKNIRNFKDWMNAVMSRIKEIADSPYWFTASGLIPGLSIGKLWFDSYGSVMTGSGVFRHSGGAATGIIEFPDMGTSAGDTVTLDDGINPATTLTFYTGGAPGPLDIDITTCTTPEELKQATILAINNVGAGLNITARDGGGGKVHLHNDFPGAMGDVPITKSVTGSFTVTGMSGGADCGTLTWTSDVYLRCVTGNYFFKIPAGSCMLPDDSVAYLTQVRNQPLPAAAPLSWVAGKDYVNGPLGAFAGLVVGDFIKKQSDGIDKYVRIADFRDAPNGAGASCIAAAALSVRLETVICASACTGVWQAGDVVSDSSPFPGPYTCVVVSVLKNITTDSNDVRVVVNNFSSVDSFGTGTALSTTSGGAGTFDRLAGEYAGTTSSEDGHYSKSQYTVTVAKRDAVPNNGDTWWLAFRDDNGSNIAKIYIGKTGAELEEGEEIQIGDEPPQELLDYIGTPSETDDTPDYSTDAVDAKSMESNYNTANGENLTVRLSKVTSMVADKAQDKTIKMLAGTAVFGWNLATQKLTWDSTLTFQIPSSNNNNTLASSLAGVTLGVGQVCYVELDRNNPIALTNVVVDDDTVPLKENVFVWARRDGDDVVVGNSFRLRPTDSSLADYSDHMSKDRLFKPVITQAAPNAAFAIFPSQRMSGNKRRYTFIAGPTASKFPRNGANQYDGGATDDNLTIIDFDAATTPGTIEVGVTYPSVARAVFASVATPTVGQFLGVTIQVGIDDSVAAVFGTPQASLVAAKSDDNIPYGSMGTFPVATVILEVTGATAIGAITEDRLIDMRPTGQSLPVQPPSVEFDKHQDALTENGFQEIFIDVLEDLTSIDSLVNFTYDISQKALVAQATGAFVNYSAGVAGVTPDLAALEPWSVNGTSGYGSVVGSRLRINDLAGSHLVYYRSETSLASTAVAAMSADVRIDASSGGTNILALAIHDGTKNIRVGVIESLGVYNVGFVNAAGTAFLGTPRVITLGPSRLLRVVKIADKAAQLWVDGFMVDALSYSAFPASVSTMVEFGTSNDAGTSDISWGTVEYSTYPNVMTTVDVARRPPTIALDMTVLPESATPAWVKGGTQTSDITTNPGKLTLTDASAIDYVSYDLSGTNCGLDVEGYKRTVIFDSLFQIGTFTAAQGALNMVDFVRIQDGYKEVIVAITYDSGTATSGLAIANSMAFGAVLAGTSAVPLPVDLREPGHSLRIEHVGHSDPTKRKILVLVDRELYYEVMWSSLNNSTSSGITFGTGSAAGAATQGAYIWDDIFISKAGEDAVIELPIIDFIGTLTTDDPTPILLYSSDGGKTWCDDENGLVAGLDYTNAANGGGEVVFMAGLSKAGAVIDDYSVMYISQRATGNGFFKYYEYTAVGGETVIPLPFSYTQGNNELEVVENGVELYLGLTRDYVETSPTQITINTAADPGDRYKIRVNHRIVTGAGGGSGTTIEVDNGGVPIVAAADTVDFTTDFSVTGLGNTAIVDLKNISLATPNMVSPMTPDVVDLGADLNRFKDIYYSGILYGGASPMRFQSKASNVGAYAFGTIQIIDNSFDAGDKVTITDPALNSYDFEVGVDFLAGPTTIDSAANLAAAIIGRSYLTLQIVATNGGTDTVTLTCIVAGTAGNSFAMSVVDGVTPNFLLSGANFTGGIDPETAFHFNAPSDIDITGSRLFSLINNGKEYFAIRRSQSDLAGAYESCLYEFKDKLGGLALQLAIEDSWMGFMGVEGRGFEITTAVGVLGSTNLTTGGDLWIGPTASPEIKLMARDDAGGDSVGVQMPAPLGGGQGAVEVFARANYGGNDNKLLVRDYDGVTTLGLLDSRLELFTADVARLAIDKFGNISLELGSLKSNVADGATAVAYALDTISAMVTTGAKLLSLQNQTVEKFFVDKDGNATFTGVVTATSFNGGATGRYFQTAIDYLTNGENIIGVTDTSSLRTIMLADVDKVAGRWIDIKDESGNAGTGGFGISVVPESGTIDGQASAPISVDYGVLRVYSDGFNWFVR